MIAVISRAAAAR